MNFLKIKIMGKPAIYIWKNKGADQLRDNHAADQHLCLRYTLLPTFQIPSGSYGCRSSKNIPNYPQKDAERMTNSSDPNHTAHLGAVESRSTLLAPA